MFEIRNYLNIRVAICEDLFHCMRMVGNRELINYSIATKFPWDELDEFTNLISGRVV